MIKVGSDLRAVDLPTLPIKPNKPLVEGKALRWLDSKPLGNRKADDQTAQDDAKPNILEPGFYRLDRWIEVVEGLKRRFDGRLFPDRCDPSLAGRCQALYEDMKDWSEDVKAVGLTKEECKLGVKIYLRLANLMQESKITPVAGGMDPANYNCHRALELAHAAEEPLLILAVAKEYSLVLKNSLPDKNSLAKLSALEDYIAKHSR